VAGRRKRWLRRAFTDSTERFRWPGRVRFRIHPLI
jgi:hypothetical protein